MKIKVLRRDGRAELISVVGPAEIHHGEPRNHLHSADGFDHYFNHDGTYDGWGAAAAEGMTMEDATEQIECIERERRIEWWGGGEGVNKSDLLARLAEIKELVTTSGIDPNVILKIRMTLWLAEKELEQTEESKETA